MLSNHLIFCLSLLLLPSVFPSIKVFSNDSVPLIRWPKYWSFRLSISPLNEYWEWSPLGLIGLILQSKGLSRIFSSTTICKYQFFSNFHYKVMCINYIKHKKNESKKCTFSSMFNVLLYFLIFFSTCF